MVARVLEWGPDPNTRAGSTSIGTRIDAICMTSCWCHYWAISTGQFWKPASSRSASMPETGGFAVWAYDTHKLPICPLHYYRVLGDEHPELERLGDAFSGLADWRPRIAQRAKDLQAELAPLARERSDVRERWQAAVDRINGEPGGSRPGVS